MFNGDWLLALAAYNAGEGRVQRLLARHNAKNFDGIAAHLPADEAASLDAALEAGLTAYTYLSDEPLA